MFLISNIKVSVSNIVERSQRNRKTFYYHFSDRSKLIQWMKQQGKKMSSAAEDAFDNTVGGLFDNMQ